MLFCIACQDNNRISNGKIINDKDYLVDSLYIGSINTILHVYIDKSNKERSHHFKSKSNFITLNNPKVNDSLYIQPSIFSGGSRLRYQPYLSLRDMNDIDITGYNKSILQFLIKNIGFDSLKNKNSAIDTIFNALYYISNNENLRRLDTLRKVDSTNFDQYLKLYFAYREEITSLKELKNIDTAQLKKQSVDIAYVLRHIMLENNKHIHVCIYTDKTKFYIIRIYRFMFRSDYDYKMSIYCI